MSRIVSVGTAENQERQRDVRVLHSQGAAARVANRPVSALASGALASGGVVPVASSPLLPWPPPSDDGPQSKLSASQQRATVPTVRPGLEAPLQIVGTPEAMRILVSGVLPASVPAALEGARRGGVELTVSAAISGTPREVRSKLAIGIPPEVVLAA
jgi:hypothetical protein